MLTIKFNKLCNIDSIDEVAIYAVDEQYYTIKLTISGIEYRLEEFGHKPYLRESLDQIKQDLSLCAVKRMFLVHGSSYDEMISSQIDIATSDNQSYPGADVRPPMNKH